MTTTLTTTVVAFVDELGEAVTEVVSSYCTDDGTITSLTSVVAFVELDGEAVAFVGLDGVAVTDVDTAEVVSSLNTDDVITTSLTSVVEFVAETDGSAAMIVTFSSEKDEGVVEAELFIPYTIVVSSVMAGTAKML